MSKYVSDTAAGRAISAYVILNKRREHVSTVHIFHGGAVLVNVWNHTTNAQARCAKARKTDRSERAAHDAYHFQHGRAGGYGYDKVTAALAGLIIDGHELTDHCGARLPLPKGATLFPRDFKVPAGYMLANWQGDRLNPDKPQGYMSCHRMHGLEYLKAIGYNVIAAI